MTKMTRTQIQKMLNKLDGKSERTALAISEFEGGVRALQEKLQQEISVSTLEEVNLKINQLRKSINLNPLLDATKTLQDEFKANALATLDEIEKKVKSLRIELTSIINEGNKATKETTDIIAKNVATVNEKIEKVSGETSEQIKQVIGTIETVSSKLPSFADKKEVEKKLVELTERYNTEELKDYTDKTRAELLVMLAQKGGGNMNRNIAVGGNVSVLSKYTDLNIRPGSNVTLTYSNNNTTKYTDLTIAATGGSGTTRSVDSTSVSSVVGSVAGTDYVVIANVGVKITLPPATSNENLYTIKNTAISSVLILPDGIDTIDTDSEIILQTQYTAVDLISDGVNNWNIT